FVLDGVELFDDAIAALAGSVEALESRPVLALGLFRNEEGRPDLAQLVDRVDGRGDGHRSLGPLGQGDVEEIARTYVGDDAVGLPAESILRASNGGPGRVHELVGEWARRRLAAAAEWMAAGRTQRAAELDFANNVIALGLGRIYAQPDTGGRGDACPYKGLASFEPSDAPNFYGRERLVGELAAR